MNIIHKTIQSSGGRLTKTKKAILDVLSQNHCLLSKQELVEKLKVKKIKPDRSTIYRELQFLTTNNIIIKNTIAGIDYYEIQQDHHHHLVCVSCNSISIVEIGNHLENKSPSKISLILLIIRLNFMAIARNAKHNLKETL